MPKSAKDTRQPYGVSLNRQNSQTTETESVTYSAARAIEAERLLSLPKNDANTKKFTEFVERIGYDAVVTLIKDFHTVLAGNLVRPDTSKGRKYISIIESLLDATAQGLEYKRTADYLWYSLAPVGIMAGIYASLDSEGSERFTSLASALEEYEQRMAQPARRIMHERGIDTEGHPTNAYKSLDFRLIPPLNEVWKEYPQKLVPLISEGFEAYTPVNLGMYYISRMPSLETSGIYLYDIITGLRELGLRKANVDENRFQYMRQGETYNNLYDILVEESLSVLTLPLILAQQEGFDFTSLKNEAARIFYTNVITFQTYFIDKVKEVSLGTNSEYLVLSIFSALDQYAIDNLANIIKHHRCISDEERQALRNALLEIRNNKLENLSDSQGGKYYKEKIDYFIETLFYDEIKFSQYFYKVLGEGKDIYLDSIDWEYTTSQSIPFANAITESFESYFAHIQDLIRAQNHKIVFHEFPKGSILDRLHISELEITCSDDTFTVVIETKTGPGLKKKFSLGEGSISQLKDAPDVLDLGIMLFLSAYAKSVDEETLDSIIMKREKNISDHAKLRPDISSIEKLYKRNREYITLYSPDGYDLVDSETAEINLGRLKFSLEI